MLAPPFAPADLPPMAIAGRSDALRAALDQAGADALVVSGLTNIRYLTGFTGSAGLLFVLPGETVLLTDGRYETQSAEQLAAAGVEARVVTASTAAQAKEAAAIVAPLLHARKLRLGLEAAHISWSRQRAFAETWFAGAELVPTEGLVEALREHKDPGELARMRAAAAIADEALARVRPSLEEGPDEAAFALALDTEIRRLGASGPSFDTIVASGPNAAKPHHRPSGRRVRDGEAVVVDFGAVVDGYCSDMTRTIWVGELADPMVVQALDLVATSQAAGVAAVKAGVACSAVDAACRQVIAEAGWGDRFVHGTGHGVGLDIHEAPSVAATSTATLSTGHVVTVEPGVYLPGHGGVRIEDTVVVTEGACEALTTAPKDLR
ncbi:MAG: aminopeptidase P family protein [Acidimicrobiaceae bacterium]|nr:aminopeptidase P family protein [Acidimicrobiaceae bacterium]